MTLPLTGERLHPEYQNGDRNHREHVARYRLACQVAARVAARVPDNDPYILDIASGEGYGSQMLSAFGSVVGVDIAQECVIHANQKYRKPDFEQGDIRSMPQDWTDLFDVVVCFETIEHVEDPAGAVAGLHRVLKPDGRLVISTPNKGVYPAGNEFHICELTAEQFKWMLSTRWQSVQMFDQGWREGTWLRQIAPRQAGVAGWDEPTTHTPLTPLPFPPEYCVAVCGEEERLDLMNEVVT